VPPTCYQIEFNNPYSNIFSESFLQDKFFLCLKTLNFTTDYEKFYYLIFSQFKRLEKLTLHIVYNTIVGDYYFILIFNSTRLIFPTFRLLNNHNYH